MAHYSFPTGAAKFVHNNVHNSSPQTMQYVLQAAIRDVATHSNIVTGASSQVTVLSGADILLSFSMNMPPPGEYEYAIQLHGIDPFGVIAGRIVDPDIGAVNASRVIDTITVTGVVTPPGDISGVINSVTWS